MGIQGLIRGPRLWPGDAHVHRRVTWMELFLDLIFVAAVAEVGTPLSRDYSAAGLLRYSFLFILIWWAWSGHTLYSTRFDADDLVQRTLNLVQSFIAAVMAANAEDALDSRSSAGFGAAYGGMRIILVIQYLRARRIPETRALATRYALGFGTAAILWVSSALMDVPGRYWMWGAALAIDFATPWLAAKHSLRVPPDAAHFPERFGLFTIILLGEFVAGVMRGIKSQEYWSLSAASTALAGLAFAFVIRWWYFDSARSAAERQVRTRKQEAYFHVWNYAHLPLFLGIGVAGVGFQRAISVEGGARLNRAEAWILCSSVAVLMLALATIGATSEGAQQRTGLAKYLASQYLIAGLAVGLGMYASRLHPVIVVAALFGGCVVQTVLTQRERLMPNRVSIDWLGGLKR